LELGQPIIKASHVFYEIDEQEAEHALPLNNYHNQGTGDADSQPWVLLDSNFCFLNSGTPLYEKEQLVLKGLPLTLDSELLNLSANIVAKDFFFVRTPRKKQQYDCLSEALLSNLGSPS
jgi:hypothetical protein